MFTYKTLNFTSAPELPYSFLCLIFLYFSQSQTNSSIYLSSIYLSTYLFIYPTIYPAIHASNASMMHPSDFLAIHPSIIHLAGYVYLVCILLIKYKLKQGRHFHLFFFKLPYPQNLEQCLALSRDTINIDGLMNITVVVILL